MAYEFPKSVRRMKVSSMMTKAELAHSNSDYAVRSLTYNTARDAAEKIAQDCVQQRVGSEGELYITLEVCVLTIAELQSAMADAYKAGARDGARYGYCGAGPE